MSRKKYMVDILIFSPCSAARSLNTETRVILLNTQPSIKIFQDKKRGKGQDEASKASVDGTEVGGLMVVKKSIFFFCLKNFIIQSFQVIKPKSGRSFLETLQWLPISFIVKTQVLKMV